MTHLRLPACALLLGLAGCIVVPLPARPPAPPLPYGHQVGALSGRPQQVDFSTALNPDCSSPGQVVFAVVTPPEHGTVAFESVEQFPGFPPGNPRAICNVRRVPGMAVVYTSAADYRGLDRFTVRALFPNGQLVTLPVAVTVE